MRRLRISAFLLLAFCATGCSSNETGTDGDGVEDKDDDDDSSDEKPGKPKDGGKPDGRVTSGNGEKDGGTPDAKPPKFNPKDESPFEKDITAEAADQLSGDDIGKLKEGGSECAKNSVLYPYDGTVYPVGLAPPAIMFAEPNDGAYLKLRYKGIENIQYETASNPTSPGELNIPIEDWYEVTSRTKGLVLEATISFLKGGKVSTCNYEWRVAQGLLTGSVYYNTYNHPDLVGMGAVMRLPFGSQKSEMYLKYDGLPGGVAGPCVSCHSVSFNGEQMAASTHNYNPLTQAFATNSYAVKDTEVQPAVQSPLPESTFAGFTPKGDKMLAMGNPDCTTGADSFPRSPNNFPLLVGPTVAALHDTKTGKVIPSKGLDPKSYMWMPQFSPAGDKVVFNYARPGPNGTNRRSLATMNFNNDTNEFSDLEIIVENQGPEPSLDYNPAPTIAFWAPLAGNCTPSGPTGVGAIPGGSCTGPCYPGWPFFTPDGKGVIYVLGSEPDFTAAFPGRDISAKSELWYVELESKTPVRLDNANQGLAEGDDLLNYYPTVLPVSAGGYFWLMWSSMRDWGHRDTNPTPGQIGTAFYGGGAVFSATRKRIWVSAIRPRQMMEGGLSELMDLSSKPFYLEGQSASGNIRAFAALNPCKQEGAECRSGIDCCTGYCDIEEGAEKGTCVPEKTCSEINDMCTKDEDCCDVPEGQQRNVCIAGICDVVIL